MGKVNYLIDMHDCRKRRRVFHVNMLRTFQVHRTTESNYFTDGVVEESNEDVLFWKDGDPDDQPTISDQLNSEQQQQLSQLLVEFSQVATSESTWPCTQLAEQNIDTGSARPIRLPPYRLPQAYRSDMHQELQEMMAQEIIKASTSEWEEGW